MICPRIVLMIRTLPTHGGPGYILFCLALASLLLYAHEWAKLREVGTQVQLSQSERPLFPVPEKEGVVRSGCNFTSSKERATLKSPSGRGKPIFVARCRGVEDACGGVALFDLLTILQHCPPHMEQRAEELLACVLSPPVREAGWVQTPLFWGAV